MQQYWVDPRARGIHHGPGHQPPPPQPATSNDIPTRMARMEIHAWYSTQEKQRAEREGWARDMEVLRRLNGLDTRVGAIEGTVAVWTAIGTWAPRLLAYALSAVIFAAVMLGKLSVEQAKALLSVFAPSAG